LHTDSGSMWVVCFRLHEVLRTIYVSGQTCRGCVRTLLNEISGVSGLDSILAFLSILFLVGTFSVMPRA
jgi:hypothetical protein